MKHDSQNIYLIIVAKRGSVNILPWVNITAVCPLMGFCKDVTELLTGNQNCKICKTVLPFIPCSKLLSQIEVGFYISN